jgi:hypothetical protein
VDLEGVTGALERLDALGFTALFDTLVATWASPRCSTPWWPLRLHSCFLAKMPEDKESSQLMPKRPTSLSLAPDHQRALAAELFNHVWTLMETEDRGARQTQMMVAAACFFWEEIGEPFRLARGEWQISRACAIANRPVEALEHAQACLELCQEHQLGAFDLACGHEALARAHQIAGDSGAAADHAQQALEHSAEISDPDERDLLLNDLAALGF